MAFKRYNIEIGQGVDVHGADTNNAVKKALADAMHHCCMAGMSEIHGILDKKGQVRLDIDVYVPSPEEVDEQMVKDYMSFMYDDVTVRAHKGGADPEGIALNGMPKTNILVTMDVITVWINVAD